MSTFAPGPTGRVSRHRIAGVFAVVGRVLIITGIVVLLFVAYELWGTNLREARAQDDLRTELDDRFAVAGIATADPASADGAEAGEASDTTDGEETAPTPGAESEPTEEELLALFFPPDGEAVARIQIPDIGVDKVVVRGVAVADLRKGPGQYPTTAPPGTTGNAAIAGHRTTYGAPFNRIDELAPGDEITVTTVQGTFSYRVMEAETAFGDRGAVKDTASGHVIVHPSAVWVLDDFGDDRLTLTACHPKLSSRERIIVAAELVDEPVEIPEAVLDARTDARTASADEIATEEVADLDEGLDGDRDAVPGAVLWLAAAAAIWFLGGLVGRRIDRGLAVVVACRAAALVPIAVCLWFAFDGIDRALPAA